MTPLIEIIFLPMDFKYDKLYLKNPFALPLRKFAIEIAKIYR